MDCLSRHIADGRRRRSTGSLPIHEIAVSFILNNSAGQFYEETLQEPQ